MISKAKIDEIVRASLRVDYKGKIDPTSTRDISEAILRELAAGDGDIYTPDQRRVCDYLQEITNGQIGCGDDPVGFLIASHASLTEQKP